MILGLGRHPGERNNLPTPVFWPGEFHELYSPQDCKESDTAERLLPSSSRVLQFSSVQFSSVQLLSHVRLFATPWTAAHQASLSIINSRSLLRLMSIESVMPSNHLILCHCLFLLPSIFPSIKVFSNESALFIRCQSIRLSASTSVLLMNTQH